MGTLSKKYRSDLVVLLEPRVSGVRAAKIIQNLGFANSIIEEAVGFSGGIWILWNQSSFSVQIIEKDEQLILVRISIPDKLPFLFTAIYANPRIEKRKFLWDELRRLHSTHQEPLLLAGDFNEIISPIEKKGGALADIGRCSEFASVLDDCQLIDLGSSGPFYTWKGPKFSHLDRVYKRLDREVANTDWRLIFDEAIVKVIPRILSDHNPILISLVKDSAAWEEKPFRFFPSWIV
ncbi:uncharacterized protein LOC133314745 [Gastrolobium bilobum]|uniref:uncharacterized protein LOC133314745 n=1 Tax=Gastrolobium bilobum TaxID=150636 RepID=UPI002AB2BAE4|nr:uncharacterized protein LOC133314745 [Gastrolobium bilobum]